MRGAFSRVPRLTMTAYVTLIVLVVACGSSCGAAQKRPLDPRTLLEQLPPPDVRYPADGLWHPAAPESAKPPVSPEPRRERPVAPASAEVLLPFPLAGGVTGSLSMPLSGSPASSAAQVRIPASGGAALNASLSARVGADGSTRTATGTRSIATGHIQAGTGAAASTKPLSTATAKLPAPHPAPSASAPVRPIPETPVASLARLASAPVTHAETASPTVIASATPHATAPQTVAAAPVASEPSSAPPAVASGAALDPELAVAAGEEEAPSAENASAEAVLTKARELRDAGSFDEMITLLDEQSELLGDHPEAAKMRLEQLLKAAKPDYLGLKRQGDIVLQSEPQDPEANYAVGLYWVYSKKADAGKALIHLGIARSSKRAPPGAGSLYWTIFAKRYGLLALLPLAGIGFIVDRLRKRRGSTSAADESVPEQSQKPGDPAPARPGIAGILDILRARIRRTPAVPETVEPAPPADETPRAGGWKARLTGIVDSFKGLVAKLTKKTPASDTATTAEVPTPTTEAAVEESSEPAETGDDVPVAEDADEAAEAEEDSAEAADEAAIPDEEISEEDFAEPDGGETEEAAETDETTETDENAPTEEETEAVEGEASSDDEAEADASADMEAMPDEDATSVEDGETPTEEDADSETSEEAEETADVDDEHPGG
ncbi:MAG TPA: hypothetical protein VIV61_17800 [Candidatus Ozemobacteraceae bacterium]